jgi:hypothetical protein
MAHFIISLMEGPFILLSADNIYIDATGALVLADHTMEPAHALAHGCWAGFDRVSEAKYQEYVAAHLTRTEEAEVPGGKPLDTPDRLN